jgi:AraC-like DNA-binding protein
MTFTAISCLLPHKDLPYSGTEVQLDGKHCFVKSGDCLIVPEGVRRNFSGKDSGHRSIWVHLSIKLEPELSFLNFFDVSPVISGDAAVRCRELVTRLNRGCRSIVTGLNQNIITPRDPGGLEEQTEDQALCFLLLKEILAVSVPKDSFFCVGSGFQELESAILWIQLHKFEKITLDDIAKHCCCSRSSFEKKFRHVFGISPGKYLQDLRLSEAAKMLRNSAASCAQIAEITGFANQFIFSRMFKQHYGISPRDYRERNIVF